VELWRLAWRWRMWRRLMTAHRSIGGNCCANDGEMAMIWRGLRLAWRSLLGYGGAVWVSMVWPTASQNLNGGGVSGGGNASRSGINGSVAEPLGVITLWRRQRRISARRAVA